MLTDAILRALNHSTEKSQSFPEKFYVEDTLDCCDLSISIAGVGSVSFPIQIQDVELLLQALGHSDIKMTLRYAHLAPEHKIKAVKKNCMGRIKRWINKHFVMLYLHN